MEIRFELNQRHGRGFQIRLVHGPVNKVYDQEPMNLYQAGAYAIIRRIPWRRSPRPRAYTRRPSGNGR